MQTPLAYKVISWVDGAATPPGPTPDATEVVVRVGSLVVYHGVVDYGVTEVRVPLYAATSYVVEVTHIYEEGEGHSHSPTPGTANFSVGGSSHVFTPTNSQLPSPTNVQVTDDA